MIFREIQHETASPSTSFQSRKTFSFSVKTGIRHWEENTGAGPNTGEAISGIQRYGAAGWQNSISGAAILNSPFVQFLCCQCSYVSEPAPDLWFYVKVGLVCGRKIYESKLFSKSNTFYIEIQTYSAFSVPGLHSGKKKKELKLLNHAGPPLWVLSSGSCSPSLY